MKNFPSRCGAFALVVTAGFVGSARTASAQISPATETAHTDAQGRHIAPHDTFYILGYVSARTDKGVEGFPPGTEVRLVSVNREAHTLTVTDGHANVELPPDRLTNDMDIAALVQAKDTANQDRIAAFQKTQSEAYEKYQKEVADYTNKDLEKREQTIREADARSLQSTGTDQQTTQPVNASVNSNGYYNQGGNGYGSPYGYFVDLNSTATRANNGQLTNTTNQTGGNKGTLSSTQNGNQTNGARAGGAQTQSSGATTQSGGAAGGAKGGKP